jgi:AbrB family transcriptional regulator, transcriptional pleiotropic regulator of transition state genes
MAKRKVDHQGRITLPTELCGKFHLKKDDVVDVTSNEEYILIKKHQPEFVCVITGKITDKWHQIGNGVISEEGIELILNFMKEKKED